MLLQPSCFPPCLCWGRRREGGRGGRAGITVICQFQSPRFHMKPPGHRCAFLINPARKAKWWRLFPNPFKQSISKRKIETDVTKSIRLSQENKREHQYQLKAIQGHLSCALCRSASSFQSTYFPWPLPPLCFMCVCWGRGVRLKQINYSIWLLFSDQSNTISLSRARCQRWLIFFLRWRILG